VHFGGLVGLLVLEGVGARRGAHGVGGGPDLLDGVDVDGGVVVRRGEENERSSTSASGTGTVMATRHCWKYASAKVAS